MLQELIAVVVSDADAAVRRSVLLVFNSKYNHYISQVRTKQWQGVCSMIVIMVARFPAHKHGTHASIHKQAHVLKTLFISLHDEDLKTALSTMKLITRVSRINPAYVIPGQLWV